ncbi:HK97 family phage prohead protease [Desulfonema magnum]|uniref:Protease domain-containing protein n=1 Tax=Desulfonema magnum TaxID=45655 RepID=A0A975BGQ8_9BACT|nr:HK97 family phage prohead protease [Desulfonema magnum]QTA85429.1 Protease domain-containing protein [Desulfonema magnum]
MPSITNDKKDLCFIRDINTRKPVTFNDGTRSVRVIAVTENPVRVWDWERKDFIDEILLVGGVSVPPSEQIPLLDSHDRSSVTSVLGSARNFEPKDNTLECEVFFAGTDSGRDAAQKVKEGHLTDFSVGYLPTESQWISAGETQDINGRTFQGPVKITTKWNLTELSVTPIGADHMAKARSLNSGSPPPVPMPKETATSDSNKPPAEIPAPEEEIRTAAEKPAGKSATEKQGITMVDMIFYGFTIMMVLFLLKGMLE